MRRIITNPLSIPLKKMFFPLLHLSLLCLFVPSSALLIRCFVQFLANSITTFYTRREFLKVLERSVTSFFLHFMEVLLQINRYIQQLSLVVAYRIIINKVELVTLFYSSYCEENPPLSVLLVETTNLVVMLQNCQPPYCTVIIRSKMCSKQGITFSKLTVCTIALSKA